MVGGGVGTGKLRAGELIEIRCWQFYDLEKIKIKNMPEMGARG